eukprot:scaffold77050_cov44-Cyclotella_meneghiniana.AAC.6
MCIRYSAGFWTGGMYWMPWNMERLPVEGEGVAKKRNKHRPIKPPVIESVTIHANPLAEDNIVYPTRDGPSEKQ